MAKKYPGEKDKCVFARVASREVRYAEIARKKSAKKHARVERSKA